MGAPVARAAVVAVAGAVFAAWYGLGDFAFNDYDYYAAASMQAFAAGDLAGFIRDAPAEGPSLLLRAPFSAAAALAGGGELAVYRALAVPALLAGVVLAVVIAAGAGSRSGRWSAAVCLLVAANPVMLRGLEMGHAEELLGAALAVGAVLAARAGKAWTATLLLGLAMGNKAWAIVAAGPVLVALPRHRLRTAVGAGAIAGVFVAPFVLAHWGPLAATGGSDVVTAGGTGTGMQPWQIWWFTGTPGPVIGYGGVIRENWRLAPEVVGQLAHPLIALLTAPLAVLFARRGPRGGDVLALLALLFALRCLLDPINAGYYHVPLLLTLAALDSRTGRGVPALTVLVTVATWVTFYRLPDVLAPDGRALTYLVWMVPLTVGLAATAFGVRLPRPSRRPSLAPAA